MKFGIDFELDLKKAEKQVETFIAETQKKMNARLRGPSNTFVPADVRSKFPGITPSAYADILAATRTTRPFTAGGYNINQATGQKFLRRTDETRVVTNPAYAGLSNADVVKTFMQRKKAAGERAALYNLVGVDNARQFMDSHTGDINWKSVARYTAEVEKAAQATEQLGKVTGRAKGVLNSMWGGGAGSPPGSRGSFMGAENYDPKGFSVRKLLRSFGVVAAGYLGVRGIHGLSQDMFSSGTDREAAMFRNSIAFGSRGQADSMYMDALRSGMPFDVNDMLEGMRTLQERGVSAKSSKGLVSGMAGRLGQSYSETASDIAAAIGGDYTVLQKYGLKQSDLMGLRHLQGNTPRMKSAVMGLLNRGDIKKQFEDGMLDFQASWEGTMKRLANQRKSLWLGIIGDPKDPNSLYGTFKNTFVKISNWVQQNQESIMRFARSVGKVLTWMWTKIETVAAKVGKLFKGLLDTFWSTDHAFERFTKRLLLGLELAYQKITAMPVTTIVGTLFAAETLNRFFKAGQFAGSSFGKGLLRGFLGVLMLEEVGSYLTKWIHGSLGKTDDFKKVAAGQSSNAFSSQLRTETSFSDKMFNAPWNWEKITAMKMLRDPNTDKKLLPALFNTAYGTEHDWTKMGVQPIIINMNNPVLTNDTTSMFAKIIADTINLQNKKKGE